MEKITKTLIVGTTSFFFSAGCTAQVVEDEFADNEQIGQQAMALTNSSVDSSTANDAVVSVAGCTGTLVGSRYVLTAGHCITKNSPDYATTVGDWQTPGAWYELFPNPEPASDLVSGRKNATGSMTTEYGFDRPGFDYKRYVTASAAVCHSDCAADSECQAYTARPGVCYLKDAIPQPRPTSGMTSGRKRRRAGRVRIGIYRDTDLPGYDYREFSSTSFGECRAACADDDVCEAFTYVPAWCWHKKPGYPVSFGYNKSEPRYEGRAMRYTIPVNDDMILLELTEAVPASIARPVPVLTDIPDNDVVNYLGNQSFNMHGFGMITDTAYTNERHTKAATFADFPRTSGPEQLLALGAGGTEVRGGDSGGPLIGHIHGQEVVVGVVQGTETGGGRYIVPFSRGGWAGSFSSPGMKNDLSRWLESVLFEPGGTEAGSLLLGDFNGDNRDDFLCDEKLEGQHVTNLTEPGGAMNTTRRTSLSGWCNDGGDALYIGDFNGDGKKDLLCHNRVSGARSVDLASSSGGFFSVNLQSSDDGFCNDITDTLYIGDFNGDGRDDLLCHNKTNGFTQTLHTPSSGLPSGTPYWGLGWCYHKLAGLYVGDFNGDGRDDILCHTKSTGTRDIDYADGSGRFSGSTDWRNLGAWCSHAQSQLYVGDFNGDGRTDLLCHTKDSGWRDLDYANSAGEFYGNNWQGTNNWCTHAGAELRVGDFNGDGRDDLLCHTVTNGTRDISLADSSGHVSATSVRDLESWCVAKRAR